MTQRQTCFHQAAAGQSSAAVVCQVSPASSCKRYTETSRHRKPQKSGAMHEAQSILTAQESCVFTAAGHVSAS